MSDDFGTVNMGRGERAREIEILRQRYRRHREALNEMTADAPTEHLATEYRRLLGELDAALLKLDELEGKAPAVPPPVPPVQHDPARQHGDPLRPKAGAAAGAAGMRPLAEPPRGAYAEHQTAATPQYEDEGAPRSRTAIILVAALLALGLIGWFIWQTLGAPDDETVVVEETTAVPVETVEDNTIAPAGSPAALTVTPAVHDFGVIRKGTRATRRYEIMNTTGEPLSIQIARSDCRCLYYEHADVIPPNAKEAVTVTIDGARASAGELRESIRVSSKSDPSVAATLEVQATVR